MKKIIINTTVILIICSSLVYTYCLPKKEIFNIFLGSVISFVISWWYYRKAGSELDIQIKRLEALVTKTTNQIKTKQEYGDAAHHSIIDGKETTTLEMSTNLHGSSKLSADLSVHEKGQNDILKTNK